jgi:ABC-2 type transport system ATP-binding protein
MQEVEAICERVIIINKGNIVADDTLNNLQKDNASQHFVSVKFKEEIDQNRLKETLDFINLHRTNDHFYIIETSHPEITRKQLLEISLSNNWNILSLNSEKRNLESIFKNLTN